MSSIYDLTIRDNRSFDSLIQFDPEQKEYAIEVPRDTFGLLIQLQYDPEQYVSIRADRDAGRYLFPDLDASMGDYFAGSEVPYYDYYKGYIVRLDKRPLSLDRDLEETITVSASNALTPPETYTIHVHRSADVEIQEKFTLEEYQDSEFGINMPYMQYVPEVVKKTEKLPLVVCLHGTGERTENPHTLVQTFAMATEWAKDSEQGIRRCIVIAPQCVLKYDEDDNWTSVNQFVHGKSNAPFWPMPQIKIAWKIIEKVCENFPVDKNRIYLTGISSGAFGVYALAALHPHVFAALVPLCGALNPKEVETLRGVPMWIFHADDDPVMQPSWSLDPELQVLDNAGISYKLTRYPAGLIFWQSGHFCWEVCYHDSSMREWVFEQKLPDKKD